jgi:glucose-1-phosphate cytidylyltransferase
VILAGGLGTRLAEETQTRPKPMVDIGGQPILWHIMKHYQAMGFNEFVIALGYMGNEIKRYFLDCLAMSGSMSISFADGGIARQGGQIEDWTVHLVDTGRDTGTGGRLRKLASWLGNETFMLTYGDGVSNVDLHALVEFHRSHGKKVTLCAVRPPSRFGGLEFEPGKPARFNEKPQVGEGWINGGFMVMEPEVVNLVTKDEESLELDILEPLSAKGDVMAYPQTGFWQCVDTMRDLRYLRELWSTNQAPWATWQ